MKAESSSSGCRPAVRPCRSSSTTSKPAPCSCRALHLAVDVVVQEAPAVRLVVQNRVVVCEPLVTREPRVVDAPLHIARHRAHPAIRVLREPQGGAVRRHRDGARRSQVVRREVEDAVRQRARGTPSASTESRSSCETASRTLAPGPRPRSRRPHDRRDPGGRPPRTFRREGRAGSSRPWPARRGDPPLALVRSRCRVMRPAPQPSSSTRSPDSAAAIRDKTERSAGMSCAAHRRERGASSCRGAAVDLVLHGPRTGTHPPPVSARPPSLSRP